MDAISERELQRRQIAYATALRRLVSPPGAIHADGSINQEFFRPSKVVTLSERRWGDADAAGLLKGLAAHGVGKWREISDDFLGGAWDDATVRLKAGKLLGSQNLSRYQGQRFSQAQAEAEFAANKALGAATGCWKAGQLVDDNEGTLRAHFAAMAASGGSGGSAPAAAAAGAAAGRAGRGRTS